MVLLLSPNIYGVLLRRFLNMLCISCIALWPKISGCYIWGHTTQPQPDNVTDELVVDKFHPLRYLQTFMVTRRTDPY